MSASWSPPPRPRRAACGHRRCTWAWRAAMTALTGACLSMMIMTIAPDWQAAATFGACALIAFGALGITCPPPAQDSGLEALIDATREPRLPRRWTAADWAQLEKELSR